MDERRVIAGIAGEHLHLQCGASVKFPGYKTAPVETGWRVRAATSPVTTSLETHTRASADKPR